MKKTKGRISKIFQKLEKGDKVAVVAETSEKAGFPKRLQGRSGIIEEIRGKAYIVKIRGYNQYKKYIIKPIHLRKLK